jgi:hypothetical protein
MAPRLIAKLIRLGGGKLLDRTVSKYVPAAPKAASGLGKGIAGLALTRIATRSVPGAIIVGGGLIAKLLYDRRHAASNPARDADGETK